MPYKALLAMLCVTAIVITAMVKGIDGLALAAGISAITGLGGFFAGKTLKK